MTRHVFLVWCGLMAAAAVAEAQHSPLVTMRIATADGQSHELTAPESNVAAFKLKDGTEYEARPTIVDSLPFNRVVVAVFKAATAKETTALLGEAEVKTGGPAVDLKTKPVFKVSVSKVAARDQELVARDQESRAARDQEFELMGRPPRGGRLLSSTASARAVHPAFS